MDVYRTPSSKDQAGRKGPAKLVDLNFDVAGATIIWQGKPFFVPLRHIRQHAEGLYQATCLKTQSVFFDSTLSEYALRSGVESINSLLRLIDLADRGAPNKNYLHGKVADEVTKKFKWVPLGHPQDPTEPFALALQSATGLLKLPSIDGVKFGTQCDRINAVHVCRRGV